MVASPSHEDTKHAHHTPNTLQREVQGSGREYPLSGPEIAIKLNTMQDRSIARRLTIVKLGNLNFGGA